MIPNSVVRNGSFWQSQLLDWQSGYAIVIPRKHVAIEWNSWLSGENEMKNINWFKYKQYLGYAIDLGRMFPLINKQRGITRLIAEISSQIIEAPSTFWVMLINLDKYLYRVISSLIPGWSYELSLIKLSFVRLETGIQSVFG